MKKLGKTLLTLPLLLVLVSCDIHISGFGGSSSNKTSQTGGGSSTKPGTSSQAGSTPINFKKDQDEINNSTLTFSDLFDLNNKVEVNVEVSKKELKRIEEDYTANFKKTEIYRHAEKVTISITKGGTKYTNVYYDVGIRQKGNTSREAIYDSDGNLNKNHFKLSFDETFDSYEMYGSEAYNYTGKESEYKARGDRNILGLSGIDFKWNKNEDSTHIKEIFASRLYEENKVLAQHVGLSTFSLKESDGDKTLDLGVVTLYEPATKSLIKRSLGSGKELYNLPTWKEEKKGTYGVPDVNYGDLYKCSYGVGFGAASGGADLTSNSCTGKKIGVGDISGSYIPAYERKTNTDVTYDDNQLKALVSAIDQYRTSALYKRFDCSYFALVEACNYLIGNPDDFRNNCNNYMIYFRRTDGKAITIPIDNDRCFGITKGYNPNGNGMMKVGPVDERNANNKLCPQVFQMTILDEYSSYYSEYIENIKTIANSNFFTNDTFNAIFETAKTTYGNDTKIVNFALDDKTNYSFSTYRLNKLTTFKKAIGEVEVPTDGNMGDIYLNGSFADWGAGTNYKFDFKGNGLYELDFKPNKTSSGTIKCKIYDGGDYTRVDWVISGDEMNELNFNGKNSSSFVISNIGNDDRVKISFNTLTKAASITVYTPTAE